MDLASAPKKPKPGLGTANGVKKERRKTFNQELCAARSRVAFFPKPRLCTVLVVLSQETAGGEFRVYRASRMLL